MRNTWRMWVFGSLVGLLVGLAVGAASLPTYPARAAVLVTETSSATGYPDVDATRALLPTLRYLIQSSTVLQAAADELPGQWTVTQLRSALELHVPAGSVVMHVIVRGGEPGPAREAVAEIIRQFARELAAVLPDLDLIPLDEPEIDNILIRPTAFLWPAGGALSGLMLGGVLAMVLRAREESSSW